jgi:alpha-ketoglutarate-dependent taurine dioxygenase
MKRATFMMFMEFLVWRYNEKKRVLFRAQHAADGEQARLRQREADLFADVDVEFDHEPEYGDHQNEDFDDDDANEDFDDVDMGVSGAHDAAGNGRAVGGASVQAEVAALEDEDDVHM